ncbi:hypothetical protein M378DRAFT_186543 [Amanita muscaria Koide BX008]|uniref:VHS domain-containing protein n=1 Tax=Amanita muscaria (strain Koide BX008) TaxID=946122 RepID=A0A0C2X8N1_AMAMK|nr:hypothetical protein M378DRAFT_186543 [Amanita muscaria Koide BX008]
MLLSSPTTSSWTKVSPLEVIITRACEPSLHEPNYALHLEVAEYINTKKANTPREAAMQIARLANHRNPHIALLSIALLDTLVQSCGYPFHLQISTKEFLNELVRRFPEHPPLSQTPVMIRILELVNSWKEGICSESRWKDDLGNIRDMHRLLTYKGYRFREIPRQTNLASASNIKSAEELEEEDRAAQSAKLQELIRRGTPRDLAAAQELMKALAGANPDTKPDYRAQALNELNKLETKVILLNEMLDNVDVVRGEKFAQGDAYEQVATILSGARPKIQKWVSDAETDDPESLDTFLQINDQINTVLDRYEAFKKGDYVAAKNPVPPELAAAAASSSQGDSLIDFDDGPRANNNAANGGLNDLTDLFSAPALQPQQPPSFTFSASPPHPQRLFSALAPQLQQSSFAFSGQSQPQTFTSTMGSSRTMAQPAIATMHAPTPVSYNGANSGLFNTLGQNAASPPSQTITPPAAIMLPSTPQQNPKPAPNYFNNGLSPPKGPVQYGTGRGMGAMTGQRQTPQTQQGQTQSSGSQQGKDPFADLAGLF